ncbi:MAG: hypothetical protein U0670_09780 [Anaerolineae bacterium]
MANPDRARKLLVRSALVTSATIATFVGAQNLAMLDATQLEAVFTPSPSAAVVNPLPEITTPVAIVNAAPGLVIQQSAPSIIILRRAGQSTGAVNNGSSASVGFQPPAPAEIAAPAPVIVQQPGAGSPQVAAPAPVIVQQPVVQSSRSSR